VLVSEAVPHCYVSLPVVVVAAAAAVVVVVFFLFILVYSFNFNIFLCVEKNIGNVSTAFTTG